MQKKREAGYMAVGNFERRTSCHFPQPFCIRQ